MSFQDDDEDGLSASSEYEMDEKEDSSGDVPSQKAPPKGNEQPVLAQKETRQVNRAKFLVYTVLFAVALATAFGTYWFVGLAEQNDFEQQVRRRHTRQYDEGNIPYAVHLVWN
mgnify:CR=1 FL=1